MNRLSRAAGMICGGVILGTGGLLLARGGLYGLTLFVSLPIAVGAFGAWVAGARSYGKAAGAGIAAGMISSLLLLLFGVEGFACVLMSWPLLIPLGALGGALYYRFRQSGYAASSTASSTAMLAVLPFISLGWDVSATPAVYQVKSSIEIAAPVETVWHNVVTFGDIPEPKEWLFHTGLAYPKRARIEGAGRGAVRYCEFSTGPFVEPITVWDEPRLLRFSVTSNPAPMQEWSPYGDVHPRHLAGYMVSKQGKFLLTPLGNGRTLLEGTTWYQHGLWPAAYWRWWSDAIIHRIHLRVLRHIKTLAERNG